MDLQSKNTDKVSKYKREKLRHASDEYKFVKNFFDTTRDFTKMYSSTNLRIYKIVENHPTKTTTTLDEKSNNFMLFHGTDSKGVKGVLKKGFRNSKYGWFGKGVYMTDCSDVAMNYCYIRNARAFLTHTKGYIFVNEVIESEKLKTIKHEDFDFIDNDSKPENQFEKHVLKESQQANEKDYKEDVQGRKYRYTINNINILKNFQKLKLDLIYKI